jgi:hypothetical protein
MVLAFIRRRWVSTLRRGLCSCATSLGTRRSAAIAPLLADAEAEVDQGGKADEEAYETIETVDRERGKVSYNVGARSAAAR